MIEKYEVHPLESLSEQELDQLMEYGPAFTGQSTKNINAQFVRKATSSQKHTRAGLLIALVAVLLFALVGFTNHDKIAQLFTQHTDNDELGQYAVPVRGSSESQGIQMELITALCDGEETFLFVELRDESGQNRLTDDLFVDEWLWEGGGPLGGGNCQVVDFDEESNTATLFIRGVGGESGAKSTFAIHSLFSHEISFDAEIADIDLSDALSKSDSLLEERDTNFFSGGLSEEFLRAGHTEEEIEKELPLGDLRILLPGYDKGYLTNIAYQDGLLHLQIDPDNDPGNEALFADLLNTKTGETLSPLYSINGGEYQVGNTIHSNDYTNFIFEVEKERLDDYTLHLSGWYYTEVLSGDWEVKFRMPGQMETIQIPAEQPIQVGGEMVPIQNLTVSPMGINFDINSIPGNLTITAVYTDGTRQEKYTFEPHYTDTNDSEVRFRVPIQKFSDLKGIEINGTLFECPEDEPSA